ncbi:hypothetical protein [Aminobacter sp. LjRoot7]|uniref:hypothetical protein n=1 Tax=Aminobacter sp. LjRoot7 TaxID=3342335 RepID=UPI003ECED9B2
MVLQDKEFRDRTFGRVIIVGSIIRPGFEWSPTIDAERVEAVLSHMGGRFGRCASHNSSSMAPGQSGRVGFVDAAASTKSPHHSGTQIFHSAPALGTGWRLWVAKLARQCGAKRQAASAYLKTLTEQGLLQEMKAGRENLYISPALLALLGDRPRPDR